jgi:ATP-dependent protease HslVU (ClpYQ) peptidase subunit
MSTVVAIKDVNKVWMGCDSFATTENGERRPIGNEKVFRNAKYLIGFIGSVRSGQLLNPHYFKPPTNILDFPTKVIGLLKIFGALATTETQTLQQESNMVIATKGGNLWELLTDFQLNPIPEYTTIGSGSVFAFGSLYTTQDTDMHPEDRIIKALEAAAYFDVSTGPPFKVHSI